MLTVTNVNVFPSVYIYFQYIDQNLLKARVEKDVIHTNDEVKSQQAHSQGCPQAWKAYGYS